jgi:tRNA(fMet)-specific endonuclease VapC
VKDRILIDTSIWIAYFKNSSVKIAEKVDEILNDADIYVPKVVIAELIQGAKTEKEVSVIGEFIGAFNVIDQKDDSWEQAGRLSFQMKRKGVTIHLVDCYIAVIAFENKCRLFSLDAHFRDIKRFLKIEMVE